MEEITPTIAESDARVWALSLHEEVLKSNIVYRFSYERL
jgi:hypothetical protein